MVPGEEGKLIPSWANQLLLLTGAWSGPGDCWAAFWVGKTVLYRCGPWVAAMCQLRTCALGKVQVVY